MEKAKLAKYATAAVETTGMAATLPVIAPFAAPFVVPLMAGVLLEETVRSIGKKGVETIGGILGNIASSAIWESPNPLEKSENQDLLRLLANAYLETIKQFDYGNDKELKKQAEQILLLVQKRLKLAIDTGRENDLLMLFPLSKDSRKDDPEYSFANRISSGDLILEMADESFSENEILADEIEISIRRWYNEQKTAEKQKETGLTQTGLTANEPLPEHLRFALREQLSKSIPKKIGELIKTEGFEKSWISFQRLHLQSILKEIKNQQNGLSKEDRDLLMPLAEKLDKLAENGLPKKLNDSTLEILSRLDQSEENVKQCIKEETNKIQHFLGNLIIAEGDKTRKHFDYRIDPIDKKLDIIIQAQTEKFQTGAIPILTFGENLDGNIDFKEIIDSKSSDDLAIKIIKAVNAEAAIIYKNLTDDKKTEPNYPTIWEKLFNDKVLRVQENYIDTKLVEGESVKDTICSLLLESYLNKRNTGSRVDTKIWLVGNAGVGKTTSLYRTFFSVITSENPYPVPLLLQPRLFEEKTVEWLDSIKDNDLFLMGLIKIWLANRDILLPSEKFSEFHKSLVKNLKSGEIVIFMDSYDELVRFKFQTKFFENLLKGAKICVSASRPETYDHKEGNTILKINDVWKLKTVRTFLKDRLGSDEFISEFENYIKTEKSQAKWLRNPRYLNLFVNLINENNKTDNTQNLIKLLKEGEYSLLKKIHDRTIERLARNLPKISPLKSEEREVFHTKLTEKFKKIASSELERGTLQVTEEEHNNDPYWKIIDQATDLLQKPVFNPETKSYELKFLNYNFVDYFLTEKIAAQIYARDCHVMHIHQWSNTLISYLVSSLCSKKHISASKLEAEIKRKLRKFAVESPIGDRSCRNVSDFNYDCRYMAGNLKPSQK